MIRRPGRGHQHLCGDEEHASDPLRLPPPGDRRGTVAIPAVVLVVQAVGGLVVDALRRGRIEPRIVLHRRRRRRRLGSRACCLPGRSRPGPVHGGVLAMRAIASFDPAESGVRAAMSASCSLGRLEVIEVSACGAHGFEPGLQEGGRGRSIGVGQRDVQVLGAHEQRRARGRSPPLRWRPPDRAPPGPTRRPAPPNQPRERWRPA